MPNFVWISLFCCTLWQKIQILLHFPFWHRLVVPPSGAKTRLNMGAQIQSFPYAKISKDLLSSNIIRTNFTIQQHDEQCNQSANEQDSTFLASRQCAKSKPHQTWHGHRRPRAHSASGEIWHAGVNRPHRYRVGVWGPKNWKLHKI